MMHYLNRIDIEDILPNKLSDLLEVALGDLEKVENDKRYVVDMDTWHTYQKSNTRNVCCVCLAGSVMAKSLGASVNETIVGGQYNETIAAKLAVLDYCRKGDIRTAIMVINGSVPDFDFDRTVTPHHTNKDKFRNDLLRIIQDLRKHNL